MVKRRSRQDQQGQPGLHVPSQHWPPVPQKLPSGQHVLPHWTRHVSMTPPLESRMTALQCTLHPTEATIDLQAEIAADRLHPVSVQSVPIEEFGRSQKLRVTLHAFGVMTASLVMPSGSLVVSFDDADGASGFPGTVTSFCDTPGGEASMPQANMKTAETDTQKTPILRSICWLLSA